MNSAVVASPLKLYDCCPFSDGASSVILCNEKFAKEHSKDYVKVIGSGRGGSPAALQGREHLTTIPSTKIAAEAAYKMAGITSKDVDFAEVHDCFTVAEVVDTEDLGFFKKGTGATAAQNGETKLNGSISINPSGGLKSKGHPIGATGVGQIVEVFEQLTGQSGERTVNDAKIGLAQNFGATGASCAVHVFQSV